jgi:TolB protein
MRPVRSVVPFVITFAVAAAVLLPASAANASFPGTNGRIAFSSNRTGISQIYTMRPDGSGLRQLTDVAEGCAELPNWSADGRRIAFDTDCDGPNAIYVMNRSGGHLRLVVQPGSQFDFAFAPAWSPDGQLLAFCAGPADGLADIWTVHPDGSGLQNLTNTPGDDECAPHFSPDGAWISFDARVGAHPSAIYVIRPDGAGRQRLTPYSLDAWYANWSPDSRRLVFATHLFGTHSSIWTVRSDGTGLRRLTNAPLGLDDIFPAYSPDGAHIVFTSDRHHDDFGDIYVMSTKGTNLTDITPGTELIDDALPDWGVQP